MGAIVEGLFASSLNEVELTTAWIGSSDGELRDWQACSPWIPQAPSRLRRPQTELLPLVLPVSVCTITLTQFADLL
jgi:hypothetical protein